MANPTHKSSLYLIPYGAVSIQENALSDSERVSVSVASGTVVKINVREINGICGTEFSKNADDSYPSVSLDGANTALNPELAASTVYVYLRIRADISSGDVMDVLDPASGLLVFSGNDYTSSDGVDRKAAADYSGMYLWIKAGTLSAPVDGARELEWDRGWFLAEDYVLSSDGSAALERMFKWDNDYIRPQAALAPSTDPNNVFLRGFLKTLSGDPAYGNILNVMYALQIGSGAVIRSFMAGSDYDSVKVLEWSDSSVPSAAAVRAFTEGWVREHFLCKDADDSTEHNLEMADCTVKGTLMVNSIETVRGDRVVCAESIETEDTIYTPALGNSAGEPIAVGIGLDMNDGAAIRLDRGSVGTMSFDEDIITGHGWRIDGDGHAVLQSAVIREFLEVPELRYNRITVQSGTSWNAPGAGIVRSVTPGSLFLDLKLEEGEVGSFAADDICMGIFHNESGNATSDDEGSFQYAGFTTAYFRVDRVEDYTDGGVTYTNGRVHYSLRDGYTFHPQPSMAIVAYGSFSDSSRQSSAYTTRTFKRYLRNVSSYDITEANIAMHMGRMDGLLKDYSGYSAYLSNIYMAGTIRELDAEGNAKVSLNYRGDFSGNATYSYGDEVVADGTLWIWINSKSGNVEPEAANSEYWTGVGGKGETGLTGAVVRMRGRWTDSAQYVNSVSFIDVVLYEGSCYRCKVTCRGARPLSNAGVLDSTHWDAFNEFENVATSVLLADSGYIDVLGAGSLFVGQSLSQGEATPRGSGWYMTEGMIQWQGSDADGDLVRGVSLNADGSLSCGDCGRLTLKADQLVCRNNNGEKTAWLDNLGNFTTAGIQSQLVQRVADMDKFLDLFIPFMGSVIVPGDDVTAESWKTADESFYCDVSLGLTYGSFTATAKAISPICSEQLWLVGSGNRKPDMYMSLDMRAAQGVIEFSFLPPYISGGGLGSSNSIGCIVLPFFAYDGYSDGAWSTEYMRTPTRMEDGVTAFISIRQIRSLVGRRMTLINRRGQVLFVVNDYESYIVIEPDEYVTLEFVGERFGNVNLDYTDIYGNEVNRQVDTCKFYWRRVETECFYSMNDSFLDDGNFGLGFSI